MTRRAVAWLGCWLALLGTIFAEEPQATDAARPIPPWQRLLQEDDAARAKDLEKKRKELPAADDYAAALSAAEELLALRERVQGADHWETVDTRWYLDALRSCAALPDDERAEWNQAYGGELRAEELHAQGQYAAALPLLERILPLSERVLGPDHPHTATRANDLAVVLNLLNRFDQADPLYRRGLDIRRRVLGEDHPDTGLGYNNRAYNLQAMGLVEQADPLYQRALAIFHRVLGEDHEHTVMVCTNAAGCKFAQGDYAAAATLSVQVAGSIVHILPADDPRVATAYNNLAAVYNAQGKYAEGEALNRRVLEFRLAHIPNSPDTGLSYNNLAFSLMGQERYVEAAAESERALEIFRRSLPADHTYFAMTHSNLGKCRNVEGRYAEAELHLEEALRIVRRTVPPGHSYLGTVLNNFASNLNAQGRFAEAEPIFREALELRRRVLGDGHPDTVVSWSNLASGLHAEGRRAEARDAVLAAAAGFDAARMRIAGRGLERAAFAGDYSPYPLLAALEALSGRQPAAWQALESDLARGLLDESATRAGATLNETEDRRREGLLASLQGIEQQVQALVATGLPTDDARQQFDALLGERAAAERELAALAAAFSRRQVADLAAVQSALAEAEAFVAWVDVVDGGRRVQEHWGCVVRASGDPAWIPLPGGDGSAWTEEDEQLPLRLRQALSEAADLEDVQELARRLAAQRIDPLLPRLDGVTRLHVASVNAMAGVPVDVLTDRFTVGYVPSGTQFVRLKSQARPMGEPKLLALGDAIFARPGEDADPLPERMDLASAQWDLARLVRGNDWRELPGTRAEIAGLEDLFPAGAVTLLVDSAASEQRLAELRESGRLAEFRYLHLATHGEANRGSAFESALILAQDRVSTVEDVAAGEAFYDGRLTANEILEHWNLDAELVTLSSCESGLGRAGGGEGFLGFAQALLLAGSRSVCLSLWEVEDTATALLMDRFYQNLLGKREGLTAPLPKAEALAEAKRWLRTLTAAETATLAKDLSGVTRGAGHETVVVDLVPPDAPDPDAHPYDHPYFWAAFVLLGDPE